MHTDLAMMLRNFLFGAAALSVTACTGTATVGSRVARGDVSPRDSAALRARAITDHVVVISLDGLRPDAIARFEAPTLRRLIADGHGFLNAQTILPSLTLPSHTSMLTGLPPDRHGIVWNDDQVVGKGLVPVPTLFGLVKNAGLTTAGFFGKAKFRHLMIPGSLDYAQAPTGWWGRWFAARTVQDVRSYLAGGARPNLLFVHIGEPDYAGHSAGWMSWLYGRGVTTADDAVAQVTAAASNAFGRNYTLIITADHGGHGRTHGTADSVDVTIPWIAWGSGVVARKNLPADVKPFPLHEDRRVRTTDTAATVLWLLGIPIPREWPGRPVTGAFTPAVAVAR